MNNISESAVPLLSDIKWIELPSTVDTRGILTSIESSMDIPITIKRVFYMHDIISSRGEHAHIDTDQVVIAISGSFKMELSDGVNSQIYLLDDATRGLYIPRLIFIRIFDIVEKSVCLVLANTHYDMSRSLRSWDDYIKVIEKKR